MSDLSDVERDLEARFGRPLTDDEREQLHANVARAQAAYAEAAAVEDAALPDPGQDAVWVAGGEDGAGSEGGAGGAAGHADADANTDAQGARGAEAHYGAVRRTHRPAAAPAAPGTAAAPPAPAAPARPATAGDRLTAHARRLFGPVITGVFVLAKWSAVIFKLKFLGLFLSVGAFQLLWRSWWMAIGAVALIVVHELGHMVEAKRQGLPVTWPQFIPFVGAYVLLKDPPKDAYRSALVSLGGPVLGSLAAVALWVAAALTGSDNLLALAHWGILINLINLAPIGFLDGGKIVDALEPRVWLAVIALLGIGAAVIHNGLLIIVLIASAVGVWTRWKQIDVRAVTPYYMIGRARMAAVAIMYVGLAALLVAGIEATDVPR